MKNLKNFQKIQKFAENPKTFEKTQNFMKISKSSKNLKIFGKSENFRKISKHQDFADGRSDRAPKFFILGPVFEKVGAPKNPNFGTNRPLG